MRKATKRLARISVFIATTALVLSACGSGDIKDTSNAGGASCDDTLDMALNPWVGYTADAYVVGRVAETQLGCKVNYKNLAEELSWAGFGSGEVDVVMENWGHPDLV